MKKLQTLLNEYSDKFINDTIKRWGIESDAQKVNIAKKLIQRFDQIKNTLSQKTDIIVVPDSAKNKDLKDLNLYSFDDLVKLIKSYPENPEKVKKEAIDNLVKNEGIDRGRATSYINRFIAKIEDIKYAFNNGTEDGQFTAEEIKAFIPKQIQRDNMFLNPRNWRWEPLEKLLDAVYPVYKESNEDENTVSTNADLIYSKDGIEIYKGDDISKCISYNPVLPDKMKKYAWCVTQPGNTNYDGYRFTDRSPTFYFIFDRNKSSEPNRRPFDDKWHAYVIQINADNQTYEITDADNSFEKKAKSWEDLSNIIPKDSWDKIKNLKDYFKPIALSGVERGRKFAAGKNLSLSEFKELDQNDKIQYIQGKASKNQLPNEILKVLPSYKISFEGRSTTLMNVAIDSGQEIPYALLKDYEPLAKRYAIFRFRHTNYGKNPIPLPYVKFLDDAAKDKYLETFEEDSTTFEYIEKFFGKDQAQKYVDKQIKNFGFLPKEAEKYIQDPKLKKLFTIYIKLFESWKFTSSTNIPDELLSSMKEMPSQDIDPAPLNIKQWLGISQAERKIILDLVEKIPKEEKYKAIIYASPIILKDGSNRYVLVPENNTDFNFINWSIIDENGRTIKKIDGSKSSLLGLSLEGGYPENPLSRVFNMKDLKAVESKDLNEIRVNEPGKLKFPIIITKYNKDKVLAQIKREKIEWNLNQQVLGINDYFKRHPDSKVKLYIVNGKLNARIKFSEKRPLEEIKINIPGKLKFPIYVTKDKIIEILHKIEKEGLKWSPQYTSEGVADYFNHFPGNTIVIYKDKQDKLKAKNNNTRPLDEIRVNPPVNVDAKSLVELWLKVHNDIGEISINYMDEFDSQINDLFKRFFSKPENNKFEGYITLEQAQMLPYNKQREAYAQLKGIEQQVSKLLTNQMNEIYEKKLILKRAGILF
jgi:hypothetical protein